jgi:hypothetical protein
MKKSENCSQFVQNRFNFWVLINLSFFKIEKVFPKPVHHTRGFLQIISSLNSFQFVSNGQKSIRKKRFKLIANRWLTASRKDYLEELEEAKKKTRTKKKEKESNFFHNSSWTKVVQWLDGFSLIQCSNWFFDQLDKDCKF